MNGQQRNGSICRTRRRGAAEVSPEAREGYAEGAPVVRERSKRAAEIFSLYLVANSFPGSRLGTHFREAPASLAGRRQEPRGLAVPGRTLGPSSFTRKILDDPAGNRKLSASHCPKRTYGDLGRRNEGVWATLNDPSRWWPRAKSQVPSANDVSMAPIKSEVRSQKAEVGIGFRCTERMPTVFRKRLWLNHLRKIEMPKWERFDGFRCTKPAKQLTTRTPRLKDFTKELGANSLCLLRAFFVPWGLGG